MLAPRGLARWNKAVLGPTVGRQPGFHGPLSSSTWAEAAAGGTTAQPQQQQRRRLACLLVHPRATAGSQVMFNCRVTLAPPSPAGPIILGRAINPSKHFAPRPSVRSEPATRPQVSRDHIRPELLALPSFCIDPRRPSTPNSNSLAIRGTSQVLPRIISDRYRDAAWPKRWNT